jgi:hypothetical protein
MLDGISFRLLTEQETRDVGLYAPDQAIGAALNEDGECVSLASLRWTDRGSWCDSCTGKCAGGETAVWTRADYQQQGIFKELFFWTKGQLGIDRVYVASIGAFGRLLASRYDLIIPKNYDDSASLGNTYESSLRTIEAANRITERLASDGG